MCVRCGRILPPVTMAPPAAAPPMSMAGMGIPPPPPSPQEIDPFETVFDRPLTPEELSALKRVERSPAIGATKVMATLFGIAPLFLMFMAFMGTPFDPAAFPMIMIGCAVIAVAMGAASRAKRYPVDLTITKGSVREARGVPKRTTGPTGQSAVRLGDIEFASTAAVMQNLQEGRMNSVVFVPPNEYAPNAAARKRGWILGANGIMFKSPVSCSINPATNTQGPPPPPPTMQSIWGGK
jgi:hypothetical protein